MGEKKVCLLNNFIFSLFYCSWWLITLSHALNYTLVSSPDCLPGSIRLTVLMLKRLLNDLTSLRWQVLLRTFIASQNEVIWNKLGHLKNVLLKLCFEKPDLCQYVGLHRTKMWRQQARKHYRCYLQEFCHHRRLNFVLWGDEWKG